MLAPSCQGKIARLLKFDENCADLSDLFLRNILSTGGFGHIYQKRGRGVAVLHDLPDFPTRKRMCKIDSLLMMNYSIISLVGETIA